MVEPTKVVRLIRRLGIHVKVSFFGCSGDLARFRNVRAMGLGLQFGQYRTVDRQT